MGCRLIMKIGFSFFGILYGSGGNTQSTRDVRHCWNNIREKLIDPYTAAGHDVRIYLSTYKVENEITEQEILELIKPDKVHYSEYKNSNSFTSKYAAFNNFENESLDTIIFSRCDIHFNKILINENIDYSKFNFLFKEKNWWETHQYTTDNFYIWPHHMTPQIKVALKNSYQYDRNFHDTHALKKCLTSVIQESQINYISNIHELSDINSYYSICRSNLSLDGRRELVHPDVIDKWYK